MRDKGIPLWLWLQRARALYPHKSPIMVLTEDECGKYLTLGYGRGTVQNWHLVCWTMARWVKRKKAVSVERFERLEALAMRRYGARRTCLDDSAMGCVWHDEFLGLKTVTRFDAPNAFRHIDKLRSTRAIYKQDTITNADDAKIMCMEINRILSSGAIQDERRRLMFLRRRYETTAIHA